MPKRYKVKNYALGGEKMERNVQVSICGTATWKAMVLEESQKRKVSISQLVRQAVAEKCARESGKDTVILQRQAARARWMGVAG